MYYLPFLLSLFTSISIDCMVYIVLIMPAVSRLKIIGFNPFYKNIRAICAVEIKKGKKLQPLILSNNRVFIKFFSRFLSAQTL